MSHSLASSVRSFYTEVFDQLYTFFSARSSISGISQWQASYILLQQALHTVLQQAYTLFGTSLYTLLGPTLYTLFLGNRTLFMIWSGRSFENLKTLIKQHTRHTSACVFWHTLYNLFRKLKSLFLTSSRHSLGKLYTLIQATGKLHTLFFAGTTFAGTNSRSFGQALYTLLESCKLSYDKLLTHFDKL